MSTDSPDAAASASPPSKSFSRTPTSWDAQDDILLMHLKDNQKLGWKEIASHFHNRTPNACQFRWRRLKSGNLKNPPKSAQALGGLAAAAMAATTSSNPSAPSLSQSNKKGQTRRKSESQPPNLGLVYSPLANTTFTGYDTVSTALTGLNAVSNSSSGTPAASSEPLGPINTTSHPQTFDNLPKLDLPLDPQAHSAAAAGTLGGYFTDISVDPTLNLPHNKPHPVHSHHLGLTPRNSNVDQHPPSIHNNSIIQIVRGDDRTSVLLQLRLSVLSLPLKSMNIPHHQLNHNSLAHMPILFGGNSISGASGGTSILGSSGLPQLASTLSSIRNGSIVGPPQVYLRRLSMLVAHSDRRGSDKLERPERKDVEKVKKEKEKESPNRTPAPSQPIFKIPWSMEEDELLINRRRKELSFAELSILLPQRTEGEIWARIDALERLRNGHRALMSRDSRRRRLLLVGLDDVDDFYSEVDSVIGAIDSEDDDDDDDVLLDVDDSIPGHLRRGKKRRTSSAVNPLTVREGIRRKLH